MFWYLKVIGDYFNFSGRARRKEYWMFAFINLMITIVLGLACWFIVVNFEDDKLLTGFSYSVLLVYVLFTIVPSLAVTVRRLHDVNVSGWFALVQFLPYIGWLILLFFTIKDGDYGRNRYGDDPKREKSIQNNWIEINS